MALIVSAACRTCHAGWWLPATFTHEFGVEDGGKLTYKTGRHKGHDVVVTGKVTVVPIP